MVNLFKRFHGEQRGITGLETAIILIAFVVVASVFAYTVLSAGIFSSQKAGEAINTGLKQARASMSIVGGVTLKDTNGDGDVDEVWFAVSNALDGEPIDLTNTTDAKVASEPTAERYQHLYESAAQNHCTNTG